VIGEVTSVHADFFLAPHFGGFREEMEHVLLLDMAIHAFDALRCMTGQNARNVYCREWDPRGSWYRHGSSATAIFELENGAMFTYRGSWCAPGLATSWECAWRFIGTRGTLLWDGHEQLRAEVATAERNGLFDEVLAVALPDGQPAGRSGGHLGVLQDFLAAVRGGPPPETRGTDNIQSLAMTLGAISSARTGQRADITQ
jgi:predicted dehydrogenase